MYYPKLIHEYLDTGLDAPMEETLFGELARSAELREEFNQQLKLSMFAQNDMKSISPPVECTTGIFTALNFSLPSNDYLKNISGSKPGSNGADSLAAIAKFWKKHFPAMALIIALTGITGLASLWMENNGLPGKSNNASAGSMVSGKNHVPVVKSFESDQNIDRNNNVNIKNNHELLADNIGTTSQEQSNLNTESVSNIAKKSSTGRKDTYSNNSVINSEQDDSIKENNQVPELTKVKHDNYYSTNYRDHHGLKNHNDNVRSFESANSALTSFIYIPYMNGQNIIDNPFGSDKTKLYIQVRRINAGNTNNLDNLEPNNQSYGLLAFDVFYKIDQHHSVGVEFGSENFFQEFDRSINGKNFRQTQNPILFWSGVAYRYSAIDMFIPGILYPYVQVFAGANSAGSIYRIQPGLYFRPFNSFSIVLGYEFREHLFNVDQRLYHSAKYGLIYGVAVNF